MSVKLLSLKKNEDFKTLLTGKKISNKYLTIFFKNLSNKSSNCLNISFVTQKKLGNAVKRNKVKRRLRQIMMQILKISKIDLNYSYLFIAKKSLLEEKYEKIKETLFIELNKIK